MENTMDILSLNGIKYIYNYKYNIIIPAELYNEVKINSIASKYYVSTKAVEKKTFINDKYMEKYRCLGLVLTDNCNFRCKYCANSDAYEYSKGYTAKSMSYEIIDNALSMYLKNYNLSHQRDPNLKFSIMFYGGEPMMEMDKIRYVVDIVKGYKIKNPIYTITTNGSILDNDIIEFFKINNFDINISMDGYKEIHDLNRVTSSNKPTFEKVCENFYHLYESLGQDKVGIITTFDSQVSPKKLYEFYKENPIIDRSLRRVSSVNPTNTNYYDTIKKYEFYDEELNHLYKLYYEGDTTNFLKMLFNDKFLRLSKRMEFHDTTYSICSPISAKLTVGTDGKLHICEKVNENYSIGDVYTGINRELAYQYYDDIVEIRNKCSSCVFRNLCNPCFANLNREGNKFRLIEAECKEMIVGAIHMLELYCTYLDKQDWPNVYKRDENYTNLI